MPYMEDGRYCASLKVQIPALRAPRKARQSSTAEKNNQNARVKVINDQENQDPWRTLRTPEKQNTNAEKM
jgi:hypothetical protein